MPAWPELQGEFAAALRRPAAAPPEAVGRTAGGPAARRFSVYRNNVAVSLTDALAANFPVTARLVGEEFFRATARAYMAAHLPRTPLLMDYGDGFAEFVEGFEPAGELPFLADVARLERAWSAAYHAADLAGPGIETLGAIAPDDLGETRLVPHPAARLVRSAHPVASIWFAHQHCGTEEALKSLPEGGEDALVTRPDAEVAVRILPPGAGAFVAAILAGATLGAAAEAAAAGVPGFDLARAIGGLFEAGAVGDIIGPA